MRLHLARLSVIAVLLWNHGAGLPYCVNWWYGLPLGQQPADLHGRMTMLTGVAVRDVASRRGGDATDEGDNSCCPQA